MATDNLAVIAILGLVATIMVVFGAYFILGITDILTATVMTIIGAFKFRKEEGFFNAIEQGLSCFVTKTSVSEKIRSTVAVLVVVLVAIAVIGVKVHTPSTAAQINLDDPTQALTRQLGK